MAMSWAWVKDNGPRPGFEHRYRLQTTGCDEIITDETRCRFASVLSRGENVCLLEFELNSYSEKQQVGEEIVLGSHGFVVHVEAGNEEEEEGFLAQVFACDGFALPRLQDYWMPDSEIIRLAQDAFGLAKSMTASGGPPRVIPMVAWVDVCTVQQDGETLEEATDRAITAERLLPYDQVFGFSWIDEIDPDLLNFWIFELPRVRVEDAEQGLGLMKSCPICRRGPTVGSQITIVPSCKHAFHSHCIVGWMVKDNSKSCPICLGHKSS